MTRRGPLQRAWASTVDRTMSAFAQASPSLRSSLTRATHHGPLRQRQRTICSLLSALVRRSSYTGYFYLFPVHTCPLTSTDVPTILAGNMAGSTKRPRTLQRLTALTVSRVRSPAYLGDGGGLYLQVTSQTAKSWIFR